MIMLKHKPSDSIQVVSVIKAAAIVVRVSLSCSRSERVGLMTKVYIRDVVWAWI